MINTKRPNTDDYTQVGFIEAKDGQDNYQNIDHIYDSEGNIVFQQGYLNEYDGADDFSISAIGKPLIDYTIYGNTEQIGIPTPDNPIMPEGTGDRTGNLLPEFYATSGEISGNSYTIAKNSIETHNDGSVLGAYYVLTEFKRYGNYANYTIIDKKHSFKVPAGTYTFSGNENIHSSNNGLRLIVGQLGQTMAGATGGAQNIGAGQTFTIIEDSYVCPVLEIRSDSRVDEYTLTNPMLNSGSTPLPYESYGYKIPIMAGKYESLEEPLRAVKTYKDTIDLSTKLLTRRVKELVLTGKENWTLQSINSYGIANLWTRLPVDFSNQQLGLSSHLSIQTTLIANTETEGFYLTTQNVLYIRINATRASTVADFKSYLTSQYNAGTPVTIWYVLAEPTTETISIPSGLTGTIEGVGIQNGTPTPDNPIIPVGRGKRTANIAPPLLEWEDGYIGVNGRISPLSNVYIEKSSDYIPITGGVPYTFSRDNGFPRGSNTAWRAIGWYGLDKTFISRDAYNTVDSLSAEAPQDAAYCRLSFRTYGETTNATFNEGSAALPYEPYGYKIPISSASTTTPVYLGEAETTRRVKKLILTGEEDYVVPNISLRVPIGIYVPAIPFVPLAVISSHFQTKNSSEGTQIDSHLYTTRLGQSGGIIWFFVPRDFFSGKLNVNNCEIEYKEWLRQQYANGTPVTVWYVLATETTGIVNESLMKIGDYADSVDFSQAGVEVPTLKRPNTTEIDITTSLPPSEVHAKYRGSKTQKYDLFLAANGDFFEAKNGQSLYIGDDT